MYLRIKNRLGETIIFLNHVMSILWKPTIKTLTFYFNSSGSFQFLTILEEDGAEKVYSILREFDFGHKLNTQTEIFIDCT